MTFSTPTLGRTGGSGADLKGTLEPRRPLWFWRRTVLLLSIRQSSLYLRIQWTVSTDSCTRIRRKAGAGIGAIRQARHASRSEEHTSELQSQSNLVCRLLL